MTALEYVTLGVYLLFLPVLGFVFSKMNSSISDFLRSGGQGAWWLVGTSILMSSTSAFLFTGNASAAFEAGPTVLVLFGANITAHLVGALFLGAWFRQTGALTRADVIRMRFGKAAEQFSVYSTLILNPLIASIQLWALALFANYVFGISTTTAIVVIGCIVICYSTMGGKWAVMGTDFLQALIVYGMSILVAVLALIKIGGIPSFFGYFSDVRFASDFQMIKAEGAFPLDRFSLKWAVVIFFIALSQQMSLMNADRYLSAKDGREARKSSLLAAILMGIGSIVWFIPPMVARFLYEDEILAQSIKDPSNLSYAFIARELLPDGLLGIFVVAMFAATMSGIDSNLNTLVGVVGKNAVPGLKSLFKINFVGTDFQHLTLCKVLTIVFGSIIIFGSLLFSNSDQLKLFDAYLTINSIIGIPLVFPLIVGLWIKRVPKWSFFFLFGIAMIPSAYSVYDCIANGVFWTIQDRAMWVFVFGLIGTVIVVPFYRFSSSSYKESVEQFYQTMRTPVHFDEEIGLCKNRAQLKIMGISSMGLAGLLSMILFFQDLWWQRACTLSLVVFCAIVGGILLVAYQKERRKSDRAL